MYTRLADFIKSTPEGVRAREILSNCVHCGMCTATCPTYQLLGDELDGPRGRIYQIKEVLEGARPTRNTQRHLDRCLTCLNCETTCPSGVRYGQLLEIGKSIVEEKVRRPWRERWFRACLLKILPYPGRIGPLIRLGQFFRPLLPTAIRAKIYPYRRPGAIPTSNHARRVLMLNGCAQPAMAPKIDAATVRILDKLRIGLVAAPRAGCCGAVSYHSHDKETGKNFMRANIDAWWPHIEAGAEAIVVNASGCGAVIKQYGEILRDDPAYAAKAQRVAELCVDVVEILQGEDLRPLGVVAHKKPLAFHPPCTLQHAQKLSGKVESLLRKLGFDLVPVKDTHLCCGSAGTYSLLQPTLAKTLRDNKLDALESRGPSIIASANIGCIYHLQSGTGTPVVHWIELLDRECLFVSGKSATQGTNRSPASHETRRP